MQQVINRPRNIPEPRREDKTHKLEGKARYLLLWDFLRVGFNLQLLQKSHELPSQVLSAFLDVVKNSS